MVHPPPVFLMSHHQKIRLQFTNHPVYYLRIKLSTSVPPHFTYPTSTQPILQYSTIVSQNTLPATSTASSSNSTSKQQNILSPQTKQISRQTSSTNNDSTVITTSSQSMSAGTTTTTNSTSNNSHPPSLLANNDRTGIEFHSASISCDNLNIK